jgi:hypothetical protein
MKRGPFRLLFLLALVAAAGCATGGGGDGGGAYSTLDCSDLSLVAPGYGYSYGAYYGYADNPCVAYPSRYYVSPTPESARRNVILAEVPRPHTQVVQRPPSSFSPGQSLNANYGTVSNNTYSPTSVNPMPVMATSSSPSTTTVSPRAH